MSRVMTKKEAMRKSIRRACGKERFAGFLYFLGTLIMTVAAFFSLQTNVMFVNSGNLNVTTFWTPIVEIFHVGFSVVPIGMNFAVAVLYVLLILICLGNLIYSLLKLDALYIRGNRKIGFNQNAIAMEKLGRSCSGTFAALAFNMYFTHMFIGSEPTFLFYAVTVIFVIIHFWAGIVGAKSSLFSVEGNTIEELPRTKGRLAPFFRNVMQFAFMGGMLYFMSRANIINNLLIIFNGDSMSELFGNLRLNFGEFVSRFLNPLFQLLICWAMFALVIHMTDTTEWSRKGNKAKGMKNCRVFSMIVFVLAVAFNGFRIYLAVQQGGSALSMDMVYVAVIALAFFIEECCMAKLPNDKAEVEEDPLAFMDEEEEFDEEEPVQDEYLANRYQYVDAPAVYMQPNGVPIMVMPMTAVQDDKKAEEAAEQVESQEQDQPQLQPEEEKVYATPVSNADVAMEEYKKSLKAKWMDRAKGEPTDEEAAEKPLQQPAKGEEVIVLGDDKKVKCPYCGNVVWAKEGAPAYVCPECKEKFSFPD